MGIVNNRPRLKREAQTVTETHATQLKRHIENGETILKTEEALRYVGYSPKTSRDYLIKKGVLPKPFYAPFLKEDSSGKLVHKIERYWLKRQLRPKEEP